MLIFVGYLVIFVIDFSLLESYEEFEILIEFFESLTNLLEFIPDMMQRVSNFMIISFYKVCCFIGEEVMPE